MPLTDLAEIAPQVNLTEIDKELQSSYTQSVNHLYVETILSHNNARSKPASDKSTTPQAGMHHHHQNARKNLLAKRDNNRNIPTDRPPPSTSNPLLLQPGEKAQQTSTEQQVHSKWLVH